MDISSDGRKLSSCQHIVWPRSLRKRPSCGSGPFARKIGSSSHHNRGAVSFAGFDRRTSSAWSATDGGRPEIRRSGALTPDMGVFGWPFNETTACQSRLRLASSAFACVPAASSYNSSADVAAGALKCSDCMRASSCAGAAPGFATGGSMAAQFRLVPDERWSAERSSWRPCADPKPSCVISLGVFLPCSRLTCGAMLMSRYPEPELGFLIGLDPVRCVRGCGRRPPQRSDERVNRSPRCSRLRPEFHPNSISIPPSLCFGGSWSPMPVVL